jgi:hypothetical protein
MRSSKCPSPSARPFFRHHSRHFDQRSGTNGSVDGDVGGFQNQGRRKGQAKRMPERFVVSMNVRHMSQHEYRMTLKRAHEQGVDVLLLQSTGWQRSGEHTSEGYHVYWNGDKAKKSEVCGVHIFLSKKTWPVRPPAFTTIVPGRAIGVSARGPAGHEYYVSAYAPQEHADEEVKDAFFQKLLGALQKAPNRAMPFIGIDLNGHVGSPTLQGVVGPFGAGTCTDSGKRMMELATAQGWPSSTL